MTTQQHNAALCSDQFAQSCCFPQPRSCPCNGTTTISGTISGLSIVAGVAVNYTVNDELSTVYTNADGLYTITVPRCSSVLIAPSSASEYVASPQTVQLPNVTANINDLNFVYTPTREIVLRRATAALPA